MNRDQFLSAPVLTVSLAIPFALLLTYNVAADQTAVILALLGLALILTCSDFGHRTRQRTSFLVLAGMLCWALLSSIWSVFPHLSVQSCAFLVAWFLGFLALPQLKGEEPAERLLMVLSVPLAVFALFLIFRFLSSGQRTGGFFIDRNIAAALLNGYFFPCLFVYARARAQKRRVSVWLAVILMATFTAIAFTLSLAGIIAWIAGILLSLVLAGLLSRRALPHLIPICIACGCLYFGVMWFVSTHVSEEARHENSIVLPVERVLAPTEDSSWGVRKQLYATTWSIYRDQPFLGTGIGTFAMEYAHKRDPREWRTSGNYAHSDPLQLLMEGGPVLLLLFLSPALIVSLRLLRRMGTAVTGDVPVALTGLGFTVGLLTLYLQSAVNFVFYSPAIAMLAGMYLAGSDDLLAPAGGQAAARSTVSPQVRIMGAFLVLVYAGFMLLDTYSLVTTVPKYCESYWCKEHTPPQEERFRVAKTTASLQPGNLNARLYVINTYMNAAAAAEGRPAQLKVAALALKESMRLADKLPDMPSALITLADILVRYPELRGMVALEHSDPEDLYLRVLERDQTFMPAYQALYQLYASQDNFEAGYKLLTERALQWYSPGRMSTEVAESILSSAMDAAGRLGLHEDQYLLAIEVLRVAPENPVALEFMEKHKGHAH